MERELTIFEFSDEQRELRAAVRRFLAERSGSAQVRDAMETSRGYDDEVWKALVGQLGLVSLSIPERFGGDGGGAVDAAILADEMGAALLCAPYFSTVTLGCTLLSALADGDPEDHGAELFGRMVTGTTAAVAISESNLRWDVSGVRAEARRDGTRWLISGSKRFVVDGHGADVLLVAARVDGDVGVFAVEATADGLIRTPVPSLDLTRTLAEIQLRDVPATPVGEIAGGAEAIRRTRERALAALAAEQVGGARRCLEMTVEYAKMRHQFGVPIGSFQAVQHACADMMMDVEAADSAAYYVAWALDLDSPDVSAAAALAKAECSEAFVRVAEKALHLHGGIGYTWEHDSHLYLRRARADQYLFGDPSHHREQLAQTLGY